MTTPTLTMALTDPQGRPLDDDTAWERARALREELQDADFVLSAELAVSDAPAEPGCKDAGEVLTIGALALAILPAMVGPLLEWLRAWLMRNSDVGEVEIEVGRGEERIRLRCNPGSVAQEEVLALTDQLRARLAAGGQADAGGDAPG
ncbi:hypothetical protein [uncultured Thiohalocapsa sp.]|uniref:hypothetical protein n=1 Tax=uncultured Thiohalocapsa sp. TaxID=768990 RepID=UPI0025CDBCBD|nr:hypothetical protein [uncultured Thiohalocapsa sp.]